MHLRHCYGCPNTYAAEYIFSHRGYLLLRWHPLASVKTLHRLNSYHDHSASFAPCLLRSSKSPTLLSSVGPAPASNDQVQRTRQRHGGKLRLHCQYPRRRRVHC
jgi:hypothetical protein